MMTDKLKELDNKKHYGIGTRLRVVYFHDGIKENQVCILADTYEDEFLFQVISIDGYHAGSIEGYVEREYDKHNLDQTNTCTGIHIREQFKERVFQNIESIELIID